MVCTINIGCLRRGQCLLDAGWCEDYFRAVIPGWSEGPDLRCAIAHWGISRFRVRVFDAPRNDVAWMAREAKSRTPQSVQPPSMICATPVVNALSSLAR